MDDEKSCTVCHSPVSQWPMVFRGDPQCSVICRKSAESEAQAASEDE
jgi:hypothetical protein